ncbi:EAL domain-containing protein [Bradyrhizobium sp. Tv2a-2]|uniref:bifunctional diguanylate cyclase/phosphodiesterase n=1 Tax=Bradyrhizobium sp. Tv2a-2 TaxID=113395 RepID=UPI0032E05523
MKSHIARTFAALSATNEAILYAKSQEQLYRKVCEAAFSSGDFMAVTVFLLEEESGLLRCAAGFGEDVARLRSIDISSIAGRPEGEGVCGKAFRNRAICISNDFLKQSHSLAWRDGATKAQVGAAAALPLICGGRSVGVLLVTRREAGSITDEIVSLLERMSANISYALDNFERENARQRSERAMRRLNRMFAAISATNEAIIRVKSRGELLDVVCQAAVLGGMFNSASIALLEPGGRYLHIVAAKGRFSERMLSSRCAIADDHPEAHGAIGTSFRTGRPCIMNDYLAEPRSSHWHDLARAEGTRASASFPLLQNGDKPIGGLLFLAPEKDAFTPDLVELLARLAENVSFALDNFDRAEEKARTEQQKERLARMFAALSSTNEAIMRSRSRAELFELVCEAAAAGGRFTSTSISLARPGSDFLEMVGIAGPTAENSRHVRVSISEAHPEGRGVCGTAFRSGLACVSNDYFAEASFCAFHGVLRDDGAHAAAAFPLSVRGRTAGTMLFIAAEKDTFTFEFTELLQRLATNVSFALENFDRVDEKTKADERIEYLASHDSLTRLPNREMFNELLRHAIDTAHRNQRRFAVLFIDLDRFKVINDSLGHQAGDALLVEVAGRLKRALRASDVVARLGGDEFVVILGEADQISDVERIARNLLFVLSQPLQLSGHEWQTTASIGIAMYPADGLDVQALTKNADMAMYLAKEDGKNAFRFFTKDTRNLSIERLQLEAALRRALERGQLSLHYQPKVGMAGEGVTGVEALLRWSHPAFGAVSPAQFIPLAEETGLVVPIGRWVLREACAQAMRWLRPLSVAVNLSPRQFADEHLLDDIDEALERSGLSPQLLQLEVTESMVMRNVSRAVKVMEAIRSRGVRLAIDDFGTGYSSMSLLKQLPIDTIKIDRSFVRDLPADSEDCAIVQAIISMAKALDLMIIAEGVETPEQEGFLRELGCDEMQGFLFSRPVVAEDLSRFVQSAARVTSPPLQPYVGGAVGRVRVR